MSLTMNPLWCLLASQPLLRSRVIRTTWVCVVLKRRKVIVQYYVCWVKCQCALSRHGYKGQGVPVYQIRIKSFTFSTVLSEYVPKVSREECFYNIHKITTTTKIFKKVEKKKLVDVKQSKSFVGICYSSMWWVFCRKLTKSLFDMPLVAIGRISITDK